MQDKRQHHASMWGFMGSAVASLPVGKAFLLLLLSLMVSSSATQLAQAQTYSVIYTFENGPDGAAPIDIAIDRAGALYVTNSFGCQGSGCGGVSKLTHAASGWAFSRLYSFQGGDDASYPLAGVTITTNGMLYGATEYGGTYGDGAVYSLRPQPTVCHTALCPWTDNVLYRFRGGNDGMWPVSPVIFDQHGNIYSTTWLGGGSGNGGDGYGTVFELSRSAGGWTESVLYRFTNGADGSGPGSVVFDRAGNLYGAAGTGGAYGYGTVFKLSPSGSSWTLSVLYTFTGGSDGAMPGNLIIDRSGNLFGTTYAGGGTVYELSPSNSGWNFTLLQSFVGGAGPVNSLMMDAAGNLYGTTREDGAYGWGIVFKLTPSVNGWALTTLYNFTGGSDGGQPQGSVVMDSSGNLYGVTPWGGAGQGYSGYGVVWEIKP